MIKYKFSKTTNPMTGETFYQKTNFYNYNVNNRIKLYEMLRGTVDEQKTYSDAKFVLIASFLFEPFKETYELLIGKAWWQGAMLMYVVPNADKIYEKYGIFNKFDVKNYKDNCLIIVLWNANIPENIINNVKVLTKGRLYIP